MKIRQDTRLLAVLMVFLAFLVTWLVMAGQANQRNYRTSSLEDYSLPKPALPREPEPQRRPIMVSKWLRNVLEEAGIPVVQETTEEEDQADRGCILQGKLIWENKPWLPLKGVEVRLTDAWLDTIVPTEKRKARDPILLPPEAFTDRWGEFALRGVPTRKTLFLVARDNDLTLLVKKIRHLPLPGQMLNLYEVEVPEQGTLRGRVVDENGRLLPGVAVRAVSDPLNRGPLRDDRLEAIRVERANLFRARGHSGPNAVPQWVVHRNRLLPFPGIETDSEGTFVLHGVRAGHATLILRGKKAVAVHRGIHVEANEITDIGTLVAPACVDTLITIQDARGNWVAGAEVSVRTRGWPLAMEPIRTNLGGVAVCDCLPNVPITVFVRAQGSQIWEVARCDDRSNHFLPCTLAEHMNGSVYVVDQIGESVPEAVVTLSYQDTSFTEAWIPLPRHVVPVASEPGSFELRDLPQGKVLRLVVAAPHHAPAVVRVDVQPGKRPFQATGLAIQLRPILPMRFHVCGANDQPVARASVSIMFNKPRRRAHPGTDDYLLTTGGAVLGHTDENGMLAVPDLWQSPAWFAAWHPDYGLTPTRLVHPVPGTVVPIKLRPRGRVEGHLTFESEVPAQRWVIRALPPDYFQSSYEHNPFFRQRRTVTAPDGSFYFNDLFEGEWHLRLHRLSEDLSRPRAFRWPEGQQDEVDVLAGATVAREWDIPADPHGRFQIKGKAVLNGRPFAHAVVRLHPWADMADSRTVKELMNLARMYAMADYHRLIDAGLMETRAARQASRRLDDLEESLARMEETNQVPKALPPRVLELFGHSLAATRTDATGTFEFALRQPDYFRLRLLDSKDKQQYAVATATLTQSKGSRSAEVRFAVQTGSLRLALTTHETYRIRRRTVCLTQEPAGAVLHLRTDDRGDVFVPEIPAGRFSVTLEGRGMHDARVRNPIVDIIPGTLNIHHAYTDPYVRLTESVKQPSTSK